jgi:hypothetical protein
MKKLIPFLNVHSLALAYIAIWFCSCQAKKDITQGLVGYWPLSGDIKDSSGNDLNTVMHGTVNLNGESAGFDGSSAWLEVPANPKTQLGSEDFSVAAWIYTEDTLNDVFGDIISQYDPSANKGFHLSLKYNFGPTNTGNFRQLGFGIDPD